MRIDASHTWPRRTKCHWGDIYIYIYIQRERESESVCIYIYIYIHIHIHICIERELYIVGDRVAELNADVGAVNRSLPPDLAIDMVPDAIGRGAGGDAIGLNYNMLQ